MWQILDDYKFSDDDFDEINGSFNCDLCNNSIEDNKMYSIRKHNIDLCEKCYPSKNDVYDIQIIDRLDYSIEDKPLIWSCNFCDKKLGGGCKWYTISKKDDEPFGDICMDCYNLEKIYDYYNNQFVEINTDNYKICNRGNDCTLVNILDASPRNIPSELINEITEERIEEWTDLISSIVNVDISFGPIKNWCLISKIYNIKLVEAYTGILLECCGNNRVASLLIDNHGRVSCDIIFDNYVDYLNDKNNWKCDYVEDSEEHIKERNRLLDILHSEFSIDNDICKNVMTEYSGYIRMARDLETYYG